MKNVFGPGLVTQTKREDGAKVFANLTQNAGSLVAKGVLNAFAQKYNTIYDAKRTKMLEDSTYLSQLYKTSKEEKLKDCNDQVKSSYNDTEWYKYNNITGYLNDSEHCCVRGTYYSCQEYYTETLKCATWNNTESSLNKCF